uniref:Uncharacterized protein n=1 Tax=Lotharella globosa TaxID=91324 RepID=A0A7S3YRE0_9EUKA|mmetsp:Transcript_17655/g.35626  ORF Transcript_17655/g.35626 Transcript_17655/m.35626 type:complete len:362 (+) Transcript_17655:55-1140(+)
MLPRKKKEKFCRCVVLPESFYSIKRQLSPIRSRKVLVPAAILIYCIVLTTFVLTLLYYESQSLTQTDTVVVVSTDGFSNYDCNSLSSFSKTLTSGEEYSVSNNPAGCQILLGGSPSSTVYTDIYFAKFSQCDLTDKTRYTISVANSTSGPSPMWQMLISYNQTSGGTLAFPEYLLSPSSISANCTPTIAANHILDYYTGTYDICGPFKTRPPYSCTKTDSSAKYDTLEIVTLAFANTELIFTLVSILTVGFLYSIPSKNQKELNCGEECIKMIMETCCDDEGDEMVQTMAMIKQPRSDVKDGGDDKKMDIVIDTQPMSPGGVQFGNNAKAAINQAQEGQTTPGGRVGQVTPASGGPREAFP